MNIDSKPNVNLYIVGFMGTGKSTIGQELANLMKMDFFDSDHEITKSAKKIFCGEGPPVRKPDISVRIANLENFFWGGSPPKNFNDDMSE